MAKGKRNTITKHGVPVVVLIPATPSRNHTVVETVAELRRFRRGKRRGEIEVGELIEKGRL